MPDNTTSRSLSHALGTPFIKLYPCFIRDFGGMDEAVMLQYLMFWCSRSPDGWGYRTYEEIEQDTCITRRRQYEAIANLKRSGALRVKRKGIPARNYYFINEDPVAESFARESTRAQEHDQSGNVAQQSEQQDSCNKKSNEKSKEVDAFDSTESERPEPAVAEKPAATRPRNEAYDFAWEYLRFAKIDMPVTPAMIRQAQTLMGYGAIKGDIPALYKLASWGDGASLPKMCSAWEKYASRRNQADQLPDVLKQRIEGWRREFPNDPLSPQTQMLVDDWNQFQRKVDGLALPPPLAERAKRWMLEFSNTRRLIPDFTDRLKEDIDAFINQ